MKRKALGLMVAFLLIGSNLFAADGDLIVNGKIGIGTTGPKGGLDVTDGFPMIFINSNASSSNHGSWRIAGHAYDGILRFQGVNDANSAVSEFLSAERDATSYTINNVRLSTEGVERMRIDPNGNVGVGTTNATYLLTMEASGGGYYNQSTHSWVDGSSGRWKSNITPITGALETVLKLNGVSFKWRKRTDKFETEIDGRQKYISSSWADDPDGRDDIGLVGEDVRKVLPEVVDVDQHNSNFVTGVSYSKIIPLLIEAIKTQQRQIETLESEVAELKANK